MIRRLIAAVVFCGVITFLFFQFYHFLKQRIATSDLKSVTEKRISSFLKVPVHVNQISVGLLKHISLSGFEINREGSRKPFLIGINKIEVRYDLLSFIRRNFRVPAEIFLEAPRLTLDVLRANSQPFDLGFLQSKHGILTRFEFEEGTVELPWVRPDEKLRLINLEGRATPKKGNLFDIRFKARLDGVVSGAILSYGEASIEKKIYHLQTDLERINFSDQSQIPVKDLSGKIEVEGDTLKIRESKFLIRGIPCQLKGEVRRIFTEEPAFALTFSFQEKQLTANIDLMVDFKTHQIEGSVRFPFENYQFSGSVEGQPADFKLNALKINQIYDASGHFDSRSRIYDIEWEREGERYGARLSMAGFIWDLQVKLDHYKFFGYDLATQAVLHLKPFDELWQKGEHVFLTDIETNYIVFQYQPLRDFKGSAKISTRGVDDLLAAWGNVSELRGNIAFGLTPKTKMTLRVAPLALNELSAIGVHPLPEALEGTFEGELNIEGPVEHPGLKGMFTVTNGSIGGFKYDRAKLNFSGQLPYLVLSDSKIWLGKNSFRLNGGLDFNRRNIFEAVQIDNYENVVIWKGIELSGSLKNVPEDRLQGANLEAVSKGRVEADYKLTEHTSLGITAEEERSNKEYVTAGPKLKF